PYDDGTAVDSNFFASDDSDILKRSAKLGWDKNSVLGDPMFIDPNKGDFRVKKGSAALELGFTNFPMDQFGVKKPALKAIAKTPSLVHSQSGGGSKPQAKPVQRSWLGATLADLTGDAFSAYGVSKEEGGIVLTDIPEASTAAKFGLKGRDLIQAVNGEPVTNIDRFFKVLSRVKSASVMFKVVRNQESMKLTIELPTIVEIETASSSNGFVKLQVPLRSNRKITANQKTNNDPLNSLIDGKLGKGFGPVFGNGIHNGAYKIDLGSAQPVKSVTSWSFNQSGTRGAQKLTIYGSNSATDPGWDLNALTQLGTIDTIGGTQAEFTAASLHTPLGKPLGFFRWIVWAVSPVTSTAAGENTAFQELAVELDSQLNAKTSEVAPKTGR
ncbi:MAG: PDZ domain-containing protein, partial [Planctomicrobium sp.]|nr:PDZ domain-containing protein [Planctomicrobium sp.]